MVMFCLQQLWEASANRFLGLGGGRRWCCFCSLGIFSSSRCVQSGARCSRCLCLPSLTACRSVTHWLVPHPAAATAAAAGGGQARPLCAASTIWAPAQGDHLVPVRGVPLLLQSQGVLGLSQGGGSSANLTAAAPPAAGTPTGCLPACPCSNTRSLPHLPCDDAVGAQPSSTWNSSSSSSTTLRATTSSSYST